MRGDDQAARRTFAKIYKGASDEIIDFKLKVAQNNVEAMTQMQRSLSFWGRTKKVWTHKPYRRAIITVSAFQLFTQLSGFDTLLYYSGTLFGLFGFSNGALAGLIPAGINAVFVVSPDRGKLHANTEISVYRHVNSRSSWTTSICPH